ncbi:hypothetical protein ChUKH1_10625 [Cryptosporidium hominis]|nr:hypothetical protein ChTU502y2012_410g0005 [Cryptosporidium hominis]PPA63206.1 hypothetical protein ChUKH1_10625 [Cryptosporidium hominis]
MKSSFTFLLIILLVLSCAYANQFSNFGSLEKRIQRLEKEHLMHDLKRENLRNTYPIVGKLLLMAIEQEKNTIEYPLLGTFQSEGKCVKTKLFFYDLSSKKFVVAKYKCSNQTVNIEGKNGEYLLRTKDSKEIKKLRDEKVKFIVKKFSFNYRIRSLNKISNCPSILKSFDSRIIPENFDVETDQKYEKGHDLVHRGFYLVKCRKNVKEDSEKDLTYALFKSATLSYAVPIQSGCRCILEGTKLLVCTCDDFNYHFDVEQGILTVGETKLLTANIRGLKNPTGFARELQKIFISS